MKRIRPFALLVSAFVLLVASYALLMTSYVRIPGKLEGADFLMFYSVGRVARQFGLHQVYNLELESIAQAQTVGVSPGMWQTLLPNHPPFIFPFLEYLAGLNYRTAYFGYAILLVFLAAAGLPALYQTLRRNLWPRSQAWIVLAGAILFEPLFISVLKGQDSAVLLLGGLLWFSGLVRDDDRLAGLGLSLTLIRPQIALLLAIPFLFRRRKVFVWFCVGGLVLGLYSFALVGWAGSKDFLRVITLSAGGEGYGLAETAMFNFTGLALRLAPGLSSNLVHTLGWGLFTVVLCGLCIVWGLSKSIGYRHIALVGTLSLFAAPHLHYHDLVLLLIPVLGLAIVLVTTGRLTVQRTAILPMLASILLLFSEFWDPARFSIPYFLMVALPVFTWMVEKRYEAG
jgi:hypothetical protein